MQLEFFGSFLVFAFLALFGKVRNRWVVYIALITLFWNTYYLAFILGMALCDLGVNRPNLKYSRLTLLMSLLTGLVLGAVPLFGSTPTFYSGLSIPFLPAANLLVLPHVIGAALVLFAVVSSQSLQRGLSTRPMRYLGKISFSMYLVHVLVIGSLTGGILVWLAPHYSYFHALLIALVLSVPVILVVSHLFAKCIDGPSVRLAAKIGTNWFAHREP